MNKQDSIFYYKTAVTVFMKWFENGIISEDEYCAIETKIAEKYGLYSGSIFRSESLTCSPERATI